MVKGVYKMNTVQYLKQHNLVKPPKWLIDNVSYETIMGSVAYGVSTDNSDMDIYGFCIPPKDDVFPHLRGEIMGFGRQVQRFEQYQENGIVDKSGCSGKGQTYDVTIYSIVKYFQLCMENNPNMIDSLYTPVYCIRHITKVGQMVRDNRDLFLHKGSWHKFRGYAYAQIHKMDSKNPRGNRVELVEKYGYDIKFAYHVVRLINEVEQILTSGTIDLQRDNEILKSIRRGEWKQEEIKDWFSNKEKSLEHLYVDSKLQHSPDESKIKQLLLDCLEEHYGDLSSVVIIKDKYVQAIADVKLIVDKL